MNVRSIIEENDFRLVEMQFCSDGTNLYRFVVTRSEVVYCRDYVIRLFDKYGFHCMILNSSIKIHMDRSNGCEYYDIEYLASIKKKKGINIPKQLKKFEL
jgi:hypothetical protein